MRNYKESWRKILIFKVKAKTTLCYRRVFQFGRGKGKRFVWNISLPASSWGMGMEMKRKKEEWGMGIGDINFFFGLILNFYFKFFKSEVLKKLAV